MVALEGAQMELVTQALVKSIPSFGNPVNVGGLDQVIAIGTDGLVGMIVRHDKDNVGAVFFFTFSVQPEIIMTSANRGTNTRFFIFCSLYG